MKHRKEAMECTVVSISEIVRGAVKEKYEREI